MGREEDEMIGGIMTIGGMALGGCAISWIVGWIYPDPIDGDIRHRPGGAWDDERAPWG